jgi:isopenicillin-N epimerase
MEMVDWLHARREMLLDPSTTYLNTGSFGPLPRPVFERANLLRKRLSAQPADFMLRELPGLLWRARQHLSDFIGGQPHRLLFSSNVSSAVNLIASSISVSAPGEILLTDHEYVTTRWCWERAAERLGLAVRIAELPDDMSDSGHVVDCLTRQFSEHTRIFFFSHVLAATGAILPAERLCFEARKRGIVSVIDGAHAVVFLQLELDRISCDFYVGSGHKWLLAPTGVGFLYFGREEESRIRPLTVSWGYRSDTAGVSMDSQDRFGSTPRLRRLECEGTRDLCPWLVVPEAIEFQAAFGHENVRQRMRELAAYANTCLTSAIGLIPAAPRHSNPPGGISAFYIPDGIDASELRERLWKEFKVEVGIANTGRRSVLRICTHLFNREEDVDILVGALDAVLGTRILRGIR